MKTILPTGMNCPQQGTAIVTSANTPQQVSHLGEYPYDYDEVLDVRSPCEFEEDHIPGAVNLPVLTDAERVEVGTLYRQQGGFAAKKVGAALVSANISRHLQQHFASKPREYRPLVYCWRGGDRSASLATVLARIGWSVTVLTGGYRTYRTSVLAQLEVATQRLTFRVLAGSTGTAKTRVLELLAANNVQVLDLEQLANHYGSILGSKGPQPPQRWFESLLLQQLGQYDPNRPVWVESESARIGNRYLPRVLTERMRQSDVVQIRVPLTHRVTYLLQNYSHLLADTESLRRLLAVISHQRSVRTRQAWETYLESSDWPSLVASLLTEHYDPAYQHSSAKLFPNVRTTVDLPDLSARSLADCADRLSAMVFPEGTTGCDRPVQG